MFSTSGVTSLCTASLGRTNSLERGRGDNALLVAWLCAGRASARSVTSLRKHAQPIHPPLLHIIKLFSPSHTLNRFLYIQTRFLWQRMWWLLFAFLSHPRMLLADQIAVAAHCTCVYESYAFLFVHLHIFEPLFVYTHSHPLGGACDGCCLPV